MSFESSKAIAEKFKAIQQAVKEQDKKKAAESVQKPSKSYSRSRNRSKNSGSGGSSKGKSSKTVSGNEKQGGNGEKQGSSKGLTPPPGYDGPIPPKAPSIYDKDQPLAGKKPKKDSEMPADTKKAVEQAPYSPIKKKSSGKPNVEYYDVKKETKPHKPKPKQDSRIIMTQKEMGELRATETIPKDMGIVTYVKKHGKFTVDDKEYTWKQIQQKEPALKLVETPERNVIAVMDYESWYKKQDPITKGLGRVGAGFANWDYIVETVGRGKPGTKIAARWTYEQKKRLDQRDYLGAIAYTPAVTTIAVPYGIGAAAGATIKAGSLATQKIAKIGLQRTAKTLNVAGRASKAILPVVATPPIIMDVAAAPEEKRMAKILQRSTQLYTMGLGAKAAQSITSAKIKRSINTNINRNKFPKTTKNFKSQASKLKKQIQTNQRIIKRKPVIKMDADPYSKTIMTKRTMQPIKNKPVLKHQLAVQKFRSRLKDPKFTKRKFNTRSKPQPTVKGKPIETYRFDYDPKSGMIVKEKLTTTPGKLRIRPQKKDIVTTMTMPSRTSTMTKTITKSVMKPRSKPFVKNIARTYSTVQRKSAIPSQWKGVYDVPYQTMIPRTPVMVGAGVSSLLLKNQMQKTQRINLSSKKQDMFPIQQSKKVQESITKKAQRPRLDTTTATRYDTDTIQRQATDTMSAIDTAQKQMMKQRLIVEPKRKTTSKRSYSPRTRVREVSTVKPFVPYLDIPFDYKKENDKMMQGFGMKGYRFRTWKTPKMKDLFEGVF